MNMFKRSLLVAIAGLAIPYLWADCTHVFSAHSKGDGSFLVQCNHCSVSADLDNVLLYTTIDKQIITPFYKDFGANIISNDYSGDCGVIAFDGPVTKISSHAFYSSRDTRKALSSIIIPSKVKLIGDYAFTLNINLSEVKLGESIIEIGVSAFSGCSILSGNFEFNNKLQSIGNYAFNNCSSINSVKINSFPYFGKGAFNSVKKVDVDLSEQSFVYCESQANIPNFNSIKYTYTSNKEWGFLILPFPIISDWSNKSYQLYDVDLYVGSSNKFIMKRLADNSATTANKPFFFKKNTTSVDFSKTSGFVIGPENPEYSFDFNGFSFVGTYKGADDLSDCYVLNANGELELQHSPVVSPFGVWMEGVDDTPTYALSDEYGIIYYTSKDGVITPSHTVDGASVPYSSFGTSSIISNVYDSEKGKYAILFDAPVTTIPEYAFQGKTNLQSIELPNSLTSIQQYAFVGCSGLSDISLPDGLETIGDFAFMKCSSIVDFTFPSLINTIPKCCFDNCSSLKNITFEGTISQIGSYAFSDCSSILSFAIPENVSIINNGTFNNCTKLKSISFNGNISEIGSYAFFGCNAFTSFTVPNSVTSIGQSAFQNCKNLQSISLPNNLEKLGSYAFEGCNQLSSILIPEGITEIKDRTFVDCWNLTNVSLPSSLTSIASYAFNNCIGLTSISIPSSVSSVGDYSFKGCKNLNNLVFSKQLSSIGEYAFNNCQSLTNLSLSSLPKLNNSNALTGCHSDLSIDFDLADDSYIYVGDDSYWNVYSAKTKGSYTRAMSSIWGTAILPYAVMNDANTQYYTFSRVESGAMTFSPLKEGEQIAANTPLVFQKLNAGDNAILSGSGVASVAAETYSPSSVDGWSMTGTYKEQAVSDVYFIANDKLYKTNDGVSVSFKKFRSWFKSTVGGAATLRIVVEQSENETAILEIAEDGSVKDATEGVYDLRGNKLDATIKGQINIINGKKVFIK